MKSLSTKNKKGRGQEKLMNESNLLTFRNRLREFTNDYTLEDLERMCKVSDSVIDSYINGDRKNPKLDQIISIAKGLQYDCSLDYLLGLTDSKELNDKYSINEDLGLIDESIENLRFNKDFPNFNKTINFLLTNRYLLTFLNELYDYIFYLPLEEGIKISEKDFKNNDIEIIMDNSDIEETKLYRIIETIRALRKNTDEYYETLLNRKKYIENDIKMQGKKGYESHFYDKNDLSIINYQIKEYENTIKKQKDNELLRKINFENELNEKREKERKESIAFYHSNTIPKDIKRLSSVIRVSNDKELDILSDLIKKRKKEIKEDK